MCSPRFLRALIIPLFRRSTHDKAIATRGSEAASEQNVLSVLFVVEGYTDIRFVAGLSRICKLSLLLPDVQSRESGLLDRIAAEQLSVAIFEVSGGRLRYQWEATRFVRRHARSFDVIMAQEMLRAALASTVGGIGTGVPVVTYTCMPPVEYYRCRHKRGQQSRWRAIVGEIAIRCLLRISGRLGHACIALGPYLTECVRRYSNRLYSGHYYGVDTQVYHPVPPDVKRALRERLNLPVNAFIVFFSSRVSHEKDPETVIRAVALARLQGVPGLLMNLSGDFQRLITIAQNLHVQNPQHWIVGRPPAHPMHELHEYYQASDCLAQASLEEGLGMSPLEALSCGIPSVCTAVGGMARVLPGYARLVPAGDHRAMASEFVGIYRNPAGARQQALAGREFVEKNWTRVHAFESLRSTLEGITDESRCRR